MASGVFGLNKVYKKQYLNAQNKDFASWPESSTYGYCVAGLSPGLSPSGISNTTSRIDFSTDIVSNPGNNTPMERFNFTSTSNQLYGFFSGGQNAPPSGAGGVNSTVFRLDFSNEIYSSPGATLSGQTLGSVSTKHYGYFVDDITYRLDFENETITTPGKNLTRVSSDKSDTSKTSTQNYADYGYFVGGKTGPSSVMSSAIERIEFSTETMSLPGKNIIESTRTESMLGILNLSYGYFGGGTYPLGFTSPGRLDRLEFPTETASRIPSSLSDARKLFGATSSISHGYISGGNNNTPAVPPGFDTSSVTERLDFSNETISVTQNLNVVRKNLASVSGISQQKL